MKKLLTFTLLLLVTTSTFANDRTQKVDSLFAQWDKTVSPGCALAIIKDGEIIYERGYGMADLERDVPISPQSIFRIGSTSKQFTAACIVLLSMRGKLSLDDDIRTYIPELPAYEPPVTINNLIHHTSGIRDYLNLEYLAGKGDSDFYTPENVIDLLSRQKELNFTPGSEFLYSNSGYFLLGVIVERVSGKSLADFAAENIFKPLGMAHTQFYDDHTRIVKNRALGYSPKNHGFYINMTPLDIVGDGAVFTSVEDMFLWDQNFYTHKIGGDKLLKQVLTRGVLNNGDTLDYAFGLFIRNYRGLKMISHGGSFVGYRAEMIRFPEQRFSVVCLSNLGTFNPTRMCRKVADIYLSDQYQIEEKEAKPPTLISMSRDQLKKFAGAYFNKETGSIQKIIMNDGNLFLEAGREFKLSPIDDDNNTLYCGNQYIEFTVRFDRMDFPKKFTLTREGDDPAVFEEVKLVHPSLGELKSYVGNYYSEELDFTYQLALDSGQLFFKQRNAPEEPLEPTFQDEFMVEGLKIHFEKNGGNVEGFLLNTGRMKNIRFDKVTK